MNERTRPKPNRVLAFARSTVPDAWSKTLSERAIAQMEPAEDEHHRAALMAFVAGATSDDVLTLLTLAEHPALMVAVETILRETAGGLE